MKISKNCKIELVASKDATRFALVNPYLDGNQLVATDGKRLVAIPVELDEHDTNGPVECEVLKQSRKTAKKVDKISIQANGCYKVATDLGEVTMPRKQLFSNFPNWKQILPKYENDQIVEICFDAKYLYEVSQAIGAKGNHVKLRFVKNNLGPIQVIGSGSPDGTIAVLMPVKDSNVFKNF